jgi:hypothetical protein
MQAHGEMGAATVNSKRTKAYKIATEYSPPHLTRSDYLTAVFGISTDLCVRQYTMQGLLGALPWTGHFNESASVKK